ncbi:MAG: cbb3-type cytochrome oxidase subunit 3 [bacterium]
MNMQIVALIFVVTSFSLLFFWVYKPSNRSRFESLGRSIMDDNDPSSKSSEGGQS